MIAILSINKIKKDCKSKQEFAIIKNVVKKYKRVLQKQQRKAERTCMK